MKIDVGSELVQTAIKVIKLVAGPKEQGWPGSKQAGEEAAFIGEVFIRVDPEFDLFSFVKAATPDGMNLGFASDEEAKAHYDVVKAHALDEIAKEKGAN